MDMESNSDMEVIRDMLKVSSDYDRIISRLLESLIQEVTLHPVQFTLRWSEFDGDIDDLGAHLENLDGNTYSDGEIEQIQNLLSACSWDTVPYPGITRLSAFSKDTGNDDPRGGGCGDMGFTLEDFRWETTNPTGITLKDLTETVYRLKGSKYDYWFESYGDMEIVERSDDHMTILVDFGYGS